MGFGQAVQAAFDGGRLRRLGWPPSEIQATMLVAEGILSVRTTDGVVRPLLVTAGDVENADWVTAADA